MATRNAVPLARLSNVARRRLRLILSGKQVTHAEKDTSQVNECKYYFGFSRNTQTGLEYSESDVRKEDLKRGCSFESFAVNEENKRFKFDSKTGPISCIKTGMASSGDFKDEETGKEEQSRVMEGSCKTKKQRTRVFRRFMRTIACYKEDGATLLGGESGKPMTEQKQANIEKLENKSEFDLGQRLDALAKRGDASQVLEEASLEKCCQRISEERYIKGRVEGEEEIDFKKKVKYKNDRNGEPGSENVSSSSLVASTDAQESDFNKECQNSELESHTCDKTKKLSLKVTEGESVSNEKSTSVHEKDEDYGLHILFDESVCSRTRNFSDSKRRSKRHKKTDMKGKSKGPATGLENSDGKNKHLKSQASRNNDRSLPNYFLAIRVDDPGIGDSVQKFQESIISEEPAFKHVLISIPTLHFTLFVMSLDGQDEISKAKEALRQSKGDVQNCFSSCMKELTLCGIKTFRSKVVYVGTDNNDENDTLNCLYNAVSVLKGAYSSHGIEIAKSAKEEFVPHVTVLKMSKNFGKMKKKGIKHVDDRFLKEFVDLEFGKQSITEILLCSMLDKKEDGFYKIIDRIPLNENEAEKPVMGDM